MTALAYCPEATIFTRLGASAVSNAARKTQELSFTAVSGLKGKARETEGLVTQAVRQLGAPLENDDSRIGVFRLARLFVLALPYRLSLPDVSLDPDGEIGFDWDGPNDKALALSLRADGTLSYAARLSPLKTVYGTDYFVDTVPAEVVELIRKIEATEAAARR